MQRILKVTKSEYNLIESHSMIECQSGKSIRGVFLYESDDESGYYIKVNVDLFKNDLITQISKGADNFKSVLSKLNNKI